MLLASVSVIKKKRDCSILTKYNGEGSREGEKHDEQECSERGDGGDWFAETSNTESASVLVGEVDLGE